MNDERSTIMIKSIYARAASVLAKENHVPMQVFALGEEDGIVKAARGTGAGTSRNPR